VSRGIAPLGKVGVAEKLPPDVVKPQLEHLTFSSAPHSPQNFMPLAFSKPQDGQRIHGPGGPSAPLDPRATGIQATGARTASPSIVVEEVPNGRSRRTVASETPPTFVFL
jgi:hypothetical protein